MIAFLAALACWPTTSLARMGQGPHDGQEATWLIVFRWPACEGIRRLSVVHFQDVVSASGNWLMAFMGARSRSVFLLNRVADHRFWYAATLQRGSPAVCGRLTTLLSEPAGRSLASGALSVPGICTVCWWGRRPAEHGVPSSSQPFPDPPPPRASLIGPPLLRSVRFIMPGRHNGIIPGRKDYCLSVV